MNTLAIVVGLLFGVFSAGLCYGVSMVTSGLFARPFYRLYARVLIGICCVMLLAPALRWLATSSPMLGAVALSIAQYVAFAVLGYGVYRFNRDYLQRVFRRRKSTAYFIFGTLAYASVVTLVFLHVAVSGTPSWAGHGHGYLTAAHYGPLLVLLAVMVFHTDARLKSVNLDPRRFSRFTFVGYAISFLGLSVSTLPFVADALNRLSDVAVSSPWIQSISSAEALFIAICLYGWLVWRYESIPPLFVLLIAIIAEYHVLVTQWVLRAYGPEAWGLASLPLFASVAYLEHYFSKWDERKHRSRERQGIVEDSTDTPLRFATPFQVVQWGLAIALFAITFWTHFYSPGTSASWLGVTFSAYSVFFLLISFARQQPSFLYMSGALAGIAATFGVEPPGGPVSTIVLAGLGVIAGALACLGERGGLKLSWRTPLTDVSLVSVGLVIGLAFSRHLFGSDPYRFHAVGLLDGLALAGSMLACVACTLQYRSRLPAFGILLAAVTVVPIWSAGLGLLATIAASLIDHWVRKDRSYLLEDEVRFVGRYRLPLADGLPELLSRPLSLGGIPLALLGLTISIAHVAQGDFSNTALLGAALAALALLLLTRSYREPWLYVSGILATYFAVHAAAQGRVFVEWPSDRVLAAHLMLAAAISFMGWLVASGYASWCNALLQRCAEEREPAVRLNRDFYSGWLFHVTAIVALVPFAGGWYVWWQASLPALTMGSATIIAILFALAASAYRTKLGSYLSLIALTLAVFSGFEWLDLPSVQQSTVLAGLGLLAATISCLSFGSSAHKNQLDKEASRWLHAVPLLPAAGLDLWLRPLALYALVCSPVAALSVMQGDAGWSVENIWLRPAPLTYVMASITLLLSTRAFRLAAIYLAAIAFAYAACHSTAQWAWNRGTFEFAASSLHLLVGSTMSLASSMIAVALTWEINRRISRSDEERQAKLRANREFFAGLLHHGAFGVAALTLAGLCGLTALDPDYFARFAWVHSLCALVLTATFSLLGICYRSRLQTYGALASVVVAVLGLVAIGTNETDRLADEALAIAAVAAVFGLASWLLIKLTRSVPVAQAGGERREAGLGMNWRFNECWDHLPLPLVSQDISLWSKPLAHASTFLAGASLVPVVMLWGRTPVWIAVTPIFLASLTWLIAVFTHGLGLFGWLHGLATPWRDPRKWNEGDLFERRFLAAISAIAFGSGIHASAQLTALRALADRPSAAWHLAIASGLALLGWCVATSIAWRNRSELANDERARQTTTSLELLGSSLYARVLHHVVFLIGCLVLLASIAFGLPTTNLVTPLAIACGLLVPFFAFAGATYRSQLGSYLSLASLGWLVVQVTTVFGAQWGPVLATIAAASSLLGLVLMTLSTIHGRRIHQGERSPGRFLPATAWASPPLPLPGDSWSTLWFNPLRQASLAFVQIGVTIVVANIAWRGSWDGWSLAALVALLASALTCAIGSKLYDTALLTYIAAALVAFSVFPLLQSQAEGDPRLGVAWSVIAVIFWLVGYAVERLCRVASATDADKLIDAPLTRIYERPLIRSSAVLAILAICQSLYAWIMTSGTASLTPLLVASGAGALSLLLNARSMNVLHRFSLGRLLVYLACLAITGCCLIVTLTRWGLQAIGPNAAVTALILSSIGLVLMEWVRRRGTNMPDDDATPDDTSSDRAIPTLTFAEPLTYFGSVLAMGASLVSTVFAIHASGFGPGETLVTSIAGWLDNLPTQPVALTFSLTALVSLLTVRATRLASWLDVAVVLGSSGLLLLANDAMNWSTATLTLAALLSMNGLVCLARLVKAQSHRVESWLGLSEASCERSFFRWPLVVVTGCLILQAIYLLLIFVGGAQMDPGWTWILNGLLCAFLYFHVMYLQPNPMLLHFLVASTVVAFFGACLARGWDVTPDVALSVMGLAWGLIAVPFNRPMGNRVFTTLRLPLSEAESEHSARVLLGWSIGMTGIAVAITLPIHLLMRPHFPNLPVTLIFASMSCLLTGVRLRNVISTTASAVLFPAFIVAMAALYLEPRWMQELAGLATAVASFVYIVTEFVLRRRTAGSDAADTFVTDVSKSLITLSHILASTAVVFTLASMVILSPSPVFAMAMTLIAVSWLWMAWESGRELLVYTSMAAVFGALLYLCMVLLEVTIGRSAIAAFSVIGYSFVLYGLNILTGRMENPRASVFVNPTYYMALAAPIVVFLVTPLDQKGVAAFVFLAAGSFYLIVSQRTHARWTMYLAAALFNVAIYLWIPDAKELTGLMQLYVIPAAVTVLIFAQLHRHELKPGALTGIRSTAAGAILAVSTLEVFFARDAGLLQFVVVLILSMTGIATGISLRIRPFVSIGIAFLVINVLGQMGLQFHQEGGVIRAVILIGTGVLVLAAMIFFNIHRERIMRRYRGYLADENWE